MNENERIEIASIAASQIAPTHLQGRISLFIHRFEIKDQRKRFEIAKIAAAKNGYHILKNIHLYNLTEDQDKEVLDIAAIERCHRIDQEVSNAFFSNNIVEMKCILGEFQVDQRTLAFSHFPCLGLFSARNLTNEEIEHYAKASPFYDCVTENLKQIYRQNDDFVRRPLIETLGRLLLICQTENVMLENFKKAKPLIEELFNFREPNFRFTLIGHVVNTLKTEDGILSFEQLFKLTEKKSPKVTEKNLISH